MSAPRKGNRKFQIQLEAAAIEELAKIAEREGDVSPNALAARFIREKISEANAPRNEKAASQHSPQPEIDLRSLLLEAHKTIGELTRTITALTEERKNAPAEPAVVAPASASTAKRTGGQVRVIR